jgi:hypothetical protein
MERQRLAFDELIDQRLSQVIDQISHSYSIMFFLFVWWGIVGFSNDY